MKKLFIILIIAFTGSQVIAQEEIEVKYQRDSVIPVKDTRIKKLKTVELSSLQKKQVNKYRRSNKAIQAAIKNNATLNEAAKKEKLKQLKKEKHDTLQAILTPAQKMKIKQEKKNPPHRGVTNMPNERTAK
jgi:hypothetical protein